MSRITYRPAIDGLRAIAVTSVMLFHLNKNWLPGGFVGVDIFFVISGFLITSTILSDCVAGTFSIATFYQRRIARIFPAFFVVAIATMFAAWLIYQPFDLSSAGRNFTATSLSIANMKFMYQGNYFQASPDSQPYLHYWSLSLEEQFYFIFPLLLALLFKYARKMTVAILGALSLASLVGCVIMTQRSPVMAFFMLPTRAWELFAGCLLAVITYNTSIGQRWVKWGSALGLVLIALSFAIVTEGTHFPGWLALLPVTGAVLVLMPNGNIPAGWVERGLAWGPLVLIGRMSYSLYLWHWPVFCFVDYQLIWTTDLVRLLTKCALCIVAAVVSYLYIETPARVLLNRRENRTFGFVGVAGIVMACAVAGFMIRDYYHVNATLRNVADGGLIFDNRHGTNGKTVILMGDSNGSMYGATLRDICAAQGCKFIVVSTDGGHPLPNSDGKISKDWQNILAVIKKEKPAYLFLACSWFLQLRTDRGRILLALDALKAQAEHIVILTQPPVLPDDASREGIRRGNRPPFREDLDIRSRRLELNEYLKSFARGNISVLDVDAHFATANNDLLFIDDMGRPLYVDSIHLSVYGTRLIAEELTGAIKN